MTELFTAADVISTYTRAQALEDGFLVDVSPVAREAGFVHPAAMTREVFNDLVAWTEADQKQTGAYQDESGRLWDVLWMAKNAIKRMVASRANEREGAVIRQLVVPRPGSRQWNDPGKPRIKRKAWDLPEHLCAVIKCGPGDTPAPVLTIMYPDEN